MSVHIESQFPLPKQRSMDRPHLYLSPRALEDWLASLPTGFPERSARQVLDVVQRFNRLSLPERDRLRFLQVTGEHAYNVLKALHRQLRNVAAPPRKKETELAELAILVHYELALAYRSAFDCRLDKKLFRKPPFSNRATLVQRAMHHLRQCLTVHYLINAWPASGIWLKLYSLYSLAEDLGMLQQRGDPYADCPTETLEETFKAAVLLSLSAPQSLRGDELDALSQLLPGLAPFARLIPSTDPPERFPAFSVCLYEDRPPCVDADPKERSVCVMGPDSLEIDVTALLAEIQQRLSLKRKRREADGSELVSEYRLLKRLKSQIGSERKRQSKRIAGQFDVEVIAGLREVHHFLTDDEVAPEPPPIPGHSSDTPKRPGHRVDYNVVLNLEMVQLDTAPHHRAPEPPPTIDDSRILARRSRCKTLNFSTGGYCLTTEEVDRFHLKVGEFIALQEGGHNRWLPGTVSWVSSDGKKIQFGVNLMAPHFGPGKVVCREPKQTSASRCLLLFDSEYAAPSKILLAPGCQSKGSRLAVEFGEKTVQMELKKTLTKTHGFVEYLCAEVRPPEENTPETSYFFDEREEGLSEFLVEDSANSDVWNWPWKSP